MENIKYLKQKHPKILSALHISIHIYPNIQINYVQKKNEKKRGWKLISNQLTFNQTAVFLSLAVSAFWLIFLGQNMTWQMNYSILIIT